MNLQVLPLAITMMAGPAIMAAIVLVTHEQAARESLAFLVGVAIGTIAGVAIARGITSLLGSNISSSHGNDTAGKIVEICLVALLIAAALKNYVRRETIEPPKWLETLMTADLKKAFAAGLLVILLGPSDIVVMLTVGANLQRTDSPVTDALPFVGATVLIAALPLLAFLLFHTRAERLMPKVRDWINSHAWVVNIAVCAIFIVLILA
jgi:threonine/homoserine/homoserine lactone efflux protein